MGRQTLSIPAQTNSTTAFRDSGRFIKLLAKSAQSIMKQQCKYLVVLVSPGRPDERFETDDESEALDRLSVFRRTMSAPRVEIHTRYEPGYEWWDKYDYHVEVA
jgi:hypothetical protein